MALQRKVFRIEEQVPPRMRGAAAPAADAVQHREFMSQSQAQRSLIEPQAATESRVAGARWQIAAAKAYKAELATIYDAIGRTAADMAALVAGAKDGAQASRVSRELAAIVTGTERATQAILQAAEEIDQSAHALAATLQRSHERGLVHDIQERVVQIFEVCNFQDLTGQRVSKAVTTLRFIEEHIDRMLEIWERIEHCKPIAIDDRNDDDRQRFLNGPKLSGDAGHSTQNEIDRIFVDASAHRATG